MLEWLFVTQEFQIRSGVMKKLKWSFENTGSIMSIIDRLAELKLTQRVSGSSLRVAANLRCFLGTAGSTEGRNLSAKFPYLTMNRTK